MKLFPAACLVIFFAHITPAVSQEMMSDIPRYEPPVYIQDEALKLPLNLNPVAPELPKTPKASALWTNSEAVLSTNNSGIPCTIHARNVDITSTPCF